MSNRTQWLLARARAAPYRCEYMRLYRDRLSAILGWFTAVRAIVSVGALATWAVVRNHPMFWGGIIAAAQVTEAVEKATSLPAHVRNTHALMTSLEALFIDNLMEWDHIEAGQVDEDTIAVSVTR